MLCPCRTTACVVTRTPTVVQYHPPIIVVQWYIAVAVIVLFYRQFSLLYYNQDNNTWDPTGYCRKYCRYRRELDFVDRVPCLVSFGCLLSGDIYEWSQLKLIHHRCTLPGGQNTIAARCRVVGILVLNESPFASANMFQLYFLVLGLSLETRVQLRQNGWNVSLWTII